MGGITCLGLTSFFLYKKRPWQSEKEGISSEELGSVNTHATKSSMSSKREEGRTIIGKKYELFRKISRKDARILFEQTGIKVEFPEGKNKAKVLVGSGNFGKLRIARHLKTGKFVAVKKVKGTREIQQSRDEGALQAKLKGKSNIMSILDFVESSSSNDEPVLYQFMPLAGFGNGEVLEAQLQNAPHELQQQIVMHVAQGLLTGLQNMHEGDIYHLDLKPANIVLDQHGKVYIIDFGCAKELPMGILKREALGDIRYFSPERLAYAQALYQNQTPHPIDAEKVDAWALGITLLELFVGSYPFEQASFAHRLFNWDSDYFENKLKEIPLLNQPDSEPMIKLIKGLLDPNPNTRLSISEGNRLLNENAFSNRDEQKAAFEQLSQMDVHVKIETPVSRSEDLNYGDVYLREHGDAVQADAHYNKTPADVKPEEHSYAKTPTGIGRKNKKK